MSATAGTVSDGKPGEQPDVPPEPPLRLLLVDDDQVDRLIVQRRLGEAGLQTVTQEASSSPEALGLLETGDFDCVVLDYNLPGANGRTVLSAARSRRPPIPVVVLTGQGGEEVAVELMKAGAADYVSKSGLSASRLATALRYAVDLSRAQRATARAEEEVRSSAERARFLAEASAVLASSLELTSTLERVAQLSIPMLGDCCLVYVVDDRDMLVGVASAHSDPKKSAAARTIVDRYRPSLDHPTSLVAEVARTARTVFVSDYAPSTILSLTDDSAVLQAFRILDPRSVVFVPLQARGLVLGSLCLSRGPGGPAFGPEEIRLAEDLAGRTAVAIENATLYEAAKRARARTERLQQVTALLAAALPREEVANLFVTQVREAFDADTAWVGLVDRDGAALESIAQAGFDEERNSTGFGMIPLDANIPSTFVMRDGQGQWFSSKAALEQAYPEVAPLTAGLDQEAIIVEPLDVGGGPFGVVTLGFRHARDFSREDRDLGLALTRQFAQAMERARLFEAERASRAAAERIAQQMADAALAIARRPDVKGVLEEITQQARIVIGAHQAVTSLTVNEDWVQTINAVSLSDRYAAWRDYSEMPDGSGIYSLVARMNEPMRLTQEELESHPAWRGFSAARDRHPPMRGWLAVPLVGRGGENIGLIQLSDRYDGNFTAADESILIQLAHTAAAALENAKLYAAAEASRAEAENANRAKSEFLARMSHDLRTPLNAIGGYAQLLELGVHGAVTEAQMPAIERIQRAQQHLLTLINDILGFARLEAGQVIVEDVEVPVRAMLLELGELLQPEADRRAIHLEIEAHEVGSAQGDAERLMQVLINLTTNALKFTPSGGHVRVRSEGDDVSIRIHVSDTGVGIPSDRLDAVFDPFVQARGDATERREGVGLGLAISRELTRMMHGDLTVESEEGIGSIFTLLLRRYGRAPSLNNTAE